jgi:hypothetical protein
VVICERLDQQLYAAVSEQRGQVSLDDASAIAAAVSAHFVGLVARRYFAAGTDLTPVEEVGLAKCMANAAATVHRFICRLRLGQDPLDVFGAILNEPPGPVPARTRRVHVPVAADAADADDVPYLPPEFLDALGFDPAPEGGGK